MIEVLFKGLCLRIYIKIRKYISNL